MNINFFLNFYTMSSLHIYLPISIWFLKGKSNFHQKLKLRAISSFFLTRPRLSRWRLKEDRENNPFSVWSLKKEEEEEEEKTLFQVKED